MEGAHHGQSWRRVRLPEDTFQRAVLGQRSAWPREKAEATSWMLEALRSVGSPGEGRGAKVMA